MHIAKDEDAGNGESLKPKTLEFMSIKSEFKTLDPNVANLFESIGDINVKNLLEVHHVDIGSIIKHLGSNVQNWSIVQDIGDDLQVLLAHISSIKQLIGSNTNSLFPTIWTGIEELWELSDGIKFSDLQDDLSKTTMELIKLQDESKKLTKYWKALVGNWLPKITTLETEFSAFKSKLNKPPRQNVLVQSRTLLDSILQSTLQTPHPIQHPQVSSTATTTHINKLENMIKDLHQEINDLKAKQVAFSQQQNNMSNFSGGQGGAGNLGQSGVKYRQHFFNNPQELEAWMRAKMTHASHGLFVDLVSFSKFFGADRYIERNTMLNEIYMSSKIGYSTIADSIVASSFQNALPGAYGRSISSSKSNEQELIAQPELPSLSTFDKWDNRDGRNGRRFWIREESRKTEQQLDGCICAQLHGPAQFLAKDLLMDSYSMSDALFTLSLPPLKIPCTLEGLMKARLGP